MDDKELEEIKKSYKLSEDEHNNVQKEINDIFFKGKKPVENPRGIINIAPPGSGKTQANANAINEFRKKENSESPNVVVINSDELKPFHPKISEIAKDYPKHFTKITDQDSNTWTSDLFDEALRRKYNVIFEGTGKNTRILYTIRDKMDGYEVDVRTMAVNELNCLISILERYWGQINVKGWGRLVELDHFYECYNAIPDTIDKIEKSKVPERVQVVKRGERPHETDKIYDSENRKNNRFPNAKYAVLGGREEDEREAYAHYNANKQMFEELISREDVSAEEIDIYNRILEIVNEYEKKLRGNTNISRDDDE